jgi:hypothetical protein
MLRKKTYFLLKATDENSRVRIRNSVVRIHNTAVRTYKIRPSSGTLNLISSRLSTFVFVCYFLCQVL